MSIYKVYHLSFVSMLLMKVLDWSKMSGIPFKFLSGLCGFPDRVIQSQSNNTTISIHQLQRYNTSTRATYHPSTTTAAQGAAFSQCSHDTLPDTVYESRSVAPYGTGPTTETRRSVRRCALPYLCCQTSVECWFRPWHLFRRNLL